MSGPLSTQRWRTLRTTILNRDGHTCMMRLPGCTGKADTVDHITPRAEGGAVWDATNLRAACTHCNMSAGGILAHKEREPHSRTW